jgi:hypothetical protein
LLLSQEDDLAMTNSAHSRHSEQVRSRRDFLGLLATASAGLSVVLLTACEGSIPPRQYKRPPGHIVGGNSKGGR